ncbi:MAG TPA: hypothetical protein VKZ41_01710 [Gemmatimonadales bacterium]|nr:hypothetical protein [Gemmatimonadales bacterium]
MHQQTSRITQEHRTALPVREVLSRAKRFFPDQIGIYSAFFEKEGPQHVVMRGQGGEELVIAAVPIDDGSLITASTFLFDVQVARFFTSLAPYVAPAAVEAASEDVAGETPAESGEVGS